jgi:hypothetical protein
MTKMFALQNGLCRRTDDNRRIRLTLATSYSGGSGRRRTLLDAMHNLPLVLEQLIVQRKAGRYGKAVSYAHNSTREIDAFRQ